jgi:hypothetical protein
MASSSSKMNMPGMPAVTASAARHADHANSAVSSHSAMSTMVMGHGVTLHAVVPEWLGIAGAAMFLVIAASHVTHLIKTAGERRSWHACHVLMAVGMAFMYGPAPIDSLGVPPAFWRLVIAAAGALAALWALGGGDRAPSPIWLLTAVDLGAMLYMWSAHGLIALLSWLLVAYLFLEAAMWALDAYRQLDDATPGIRWRMLPQESVSGALTAPAAVATTASRSLIGELDIGVSMFAMALGMAYMLVAMQMMI